MVLMRQSTAAESTTASASRAGEICRRAPLPGPAGARLTARVRIPSLGSRQGLKPETPLTLKFLEPHQSY